MQGCVGAVATKRLRLPSILASVGLFTDIDSEGWLVMAVDANARICNFQLIQKEPLTVADAVELVYANTDFEFPPVRDIKNQYVFIGGRQLKGRPELIVASKKNRVCRFTPEQMKRGLQPAKLVEDVLAERFGVLGKILPAMGPPLETPTILPVICSMCCTMHNFLLENVPAYSAKFMDVN